MKYQIQFECPTCGKSLDDVALEFHNEMEEKKSRTSFLVFILAIIFTNTITYWTMSWYVNGFKQQANRYIGINEILQEDNRSLFKENQNLKMELRINKILQ